MLGFLHVALGNYFSQDLRLFLPASPLSAHCPGFPLFVYGGRAGPGSQQTAQAGLHVSVLRPQLPEPWNCSWIPPHLGDSLSGFCDISWSFLSTPPLTRLCSPVLFAGSTAPWPPFPSLSTYFSLFPWLICISSPTLPASGKATATGSGPGAVNRRDRSFPSTAWHTTLQLPFLWLQLFEKIFTSKRVTKNQSSWMSESCYERQMGWEEAQTCSRLHRSKKQSAAPGVVAHA